MCEAICPYIDQVIDSVNIRDFAVNTYTFDLLVQ
jgi:hypothetical protein